MCELTDVTASRTQRAQARAQWISFLRRDVELAVQAAVRDPKAWTDILPWLPNGGDEKVAILAIEGDYCEAGRALFVELRKQIMEDATSKAKDRIFERYGLDIDEVQP